MYLLMLVAAFGLQAFFNLGDYITCEDVQCMSWSLRRLPGTCSSIGFFVDEDADGEI